MIEFLDVAIAVCVFGMGVCEIAFEVRIWRRCRRAERDLCCGMPTRDDPNAPGPTANPATRRDDREPVVTPALENVPQQRPEDMRPDLTIRKGPATMAAERPRSKP